MTDLYAYVSSDGRTVTDWHGNELGKVIETREIPLASWSYIHGRHITHYRVSIDGRKYYGRSSRGVLIRLRPYKVTS